MSQISDGFIGPTPAIFQAARSPAEIAQCDHSFQEGTQYRLYQLQSQRSPWFGKGNSL